MTTLLMILGAIAIGLGIGMLDHASGLDKPKTKKPWKPKKKVRSPWDRDPFFGTPLEKF